MQVIRTTLRDVNKDLWILFRQKCIGENVTANAKIIQLIEKYVGKKKGCDQ